MPALYTVLRQILRVALDIYFVDIQRIGARGIPDQGPLIFAANHPNSIMDTVILGTQTSRQICYMARSGLFSNVLNRWLFNQVGVIPIYRAQDDPTQLAQNASSFTRAFEVLQQGGCIGIFPEGQNAPARQVRDIKTGTARIALGAEDENAWSLGVKIIPVGINFESRTRFLSSVLLRFGDPIHAADYRERWAEDPRAAVRALTDDIQSALREQAVHIDDHINVQLVTDIQAIYGKTLQAQLFGDEADSPQRRRRRRSIKDILLDQVRSSTELNKNLDDHFFIKQRIAAALAWFTATHPDTVLRVRNDIQRYKDHLAQLKLRHQLTTRSPATLSARAEAIKLTLYAVLFAIPALWGLINNVIPYALSRAAWETSTEEAMRTIRAFGVAFFVFPIFYALQGFALYELLRDLSYAPWLVAAYLLSLPPTGFFWLRYSRRILRFRDRILARTLFRTNRNLVRTIEREREQLIREFAAFREEFLRWEAEQKANPGGAEAAITPPDEAQPDEEHREGERPDEASGS